MMKTFRIPILLLITLGLCFVNFSKVLAVPPLPSSFYGTVKSNGSNIPIGTQVSAWINGVQYAISPYMVDGGDTVYNMSVPGDDLATPDVIEGGVPGDTVIFYVGSTQADQTTTWQSGTNINLDITAALPDFQQIYLPLLFR